MDQNFLLETNTAVDLYHNTASSLPIIDYHCHLNPAEIATNKHFNNLTEVWLGGDHYKWRQMRTAGIPEKYITGDASPYDKFLAWTKTVEKLIGNPLYHWTHLELQRYFGIYEPLTTQSAPYIWEKANSLLETESLSVKGILRSMNVFAVGTTDDPIDELLYHQKIASGKADIGKINTAVIPSFRPDKALYIESEGFVEYINKLSTVSGIQISSTDDILSALDTRLIYFIDAGCRASDHALPVPPIVESDTDTLAFVAFQKVMNKDKITLKEENAYKAYMLVKLASLYKKHSIVMQLHFGATRSNNPVMFDALGPDTGFDACNDGKMAKGLSSLLGRIESEGGLPRTILYTLNPKDYYILGTLAGCFQGSGMQDTDSIPGKIQVGAAWWFCDHKDGMMQQLTTLGNLGMLSAFVGMLTDSRSFLSYPRHEYFRRILCNLIGKWVENGEYPEDKVALSKIVSDISFNNAKNYFNLES